MNDLNIVGGTVVRSERCFEGSVGVKDGRIVSVCPRGAPLDSARETMDASGALIMPGMIDTHVHIRGGALSAREDFATGTMAAASGGVTTIMEMPVAKPPASTPENFAARKAEIEARAYVDFCMYGGAGSDNLSEIGELAKMGAAAYKTFLMPPVPGREKEFYGLCSETPEQLTAVMEKVKETGLLLAVHSELNEYVAEKTDQLMRSGRNGIRAFGESRPVEAETEAVKRVIAASRATGCRASICHVSSPESVRLIEEARAGGVDIHGETCPQYLVFNDVNAAFAGVFARMKPPLRPPETAAELLGLYAQGRLELTGSDHAPYLREEKLKNGMDIWHTFDGVPGLEVSLRLLLNQVTAGRLTYGQIARNTSESPAKLFGIDARKGGVAVGKDADLVIVRRLDEPDVLHIDEMFTKSRGSAVLYDNTPFTHRIETTLVRGKAVFSDGMITGSQGFGQLIKPEKV
jgi:allantoinase